MSSRAQRGIYSHRFESLGRLMTRAGSSSDTAELRSPLPAAGGLPVVVGSLLEIRERAGETESYVRSDISLLVAVFLLTPCYSLLASYSKYPVTSTMNCTDPEGCEQSTRKSPATPSRRIVLFARVCPDR